MARNPKPKGDRYYDRTAAIYNRKREKQSWWHVEHQQMRELLAKLPTGLRVVDIPFGTGRFVPLYLEREFKITGLEISPDMVAAAAVALGDDFAACDAKIGSAMETPFKDGEFDLVVSTRFLSNIVTYIDARRALAEFARITSRYGIIQLGHRTEDTRIPRRRETMDTCMSRDDVDAMLRANGLEPIERRLVLETPETGGEMHHILCEVIT